MNPFDLRGPQFLVFYLGLAAVVLVAVILQRRRGDPGGFPSRVDDPYLLASLRGGTTEPIRVALLSLLDRRLLKAIDGRIEALAPPDVARRPLEQAILAVFRTRRTPEDVFGDPLVKAHAAALEEDLVRSGLVDDRARRVGPAGALGAALLLAVAGTKLLIALSRGRTNVGLLVVAGFGLPILTLAAGARPRLTLKGAKAVELAQRAFGRLKQAAASIVPGGQTSELALAFAVFGAGVLPPLARDLLSEAGMERAAKGGSSCGSSSSCGGSSCGGGCGGGGCGGCGS